MNLFDQLVDTAIKNQPNFSSLRVVVEKELLHHDILRILSETQMLKNLTFIGGTCLRYCYGGARLSEDLDFTGGIDFTRNDLATMGDTLIQNLQKKYGLLVRVSEPLKDLSNVSTWKISIETRPGKKDSPAQRINIDICAIPSYERIPMLILNPYGVDMGTNGLIIQAQSREEIYADKLIAFALRPNRIKYRDLWDISWLHQQRIKPKFDLIPKKVKDRNLGMDIFLKKYSERKIELTEKPNLSLEFKQEMSRFLTTQQTASTNLEDLWNFIIYLINDLESNLSTLSVS